MVDELRDLYDYNRWANERTLDACAALSDEAMHRDMGSSFPSVIDTLAHIVSSEWIWLERWNGRSPAGPPADRDLSDLAGIRAFWAGVETDRGQFLDALTDDRLRARIDYRNTRGDRFVAPLWQLMRHMVNHSTYHRGQIATLLRQLGAVPAYTDLVRYHRER